MMAELKKGFKLIRYGYGLVLNLVVLVLFLLMGILFLCIGPEGMFLGTLYILVGPTMLMQLEYSILYSGIVAASPRHRMMEVHLADALTVISGVLSCLVLCVAGAFWCAKDPAETEFCMGAMMATGMLTMFMMVYLGIAYKYFWASIVLFIVGLGVGLDGGVLVLLISGLSYTFTNVSLIVWGCVMIGVVLSCVIRRLLYRKQLSKWAAGASLRKAMQ